VQYKTNKQTNKQIGGGNIMMINFENTIEEQTPVTKKELKHFDWVEGDIGVYPIILRVKNADHITIIIELRRTYVFDEDFGGITYIENKYDEIETLALLAYADSRLGTPL
jgi:hypothetical protein